MMTGNRNSSLFKMIWLNKNKICLNAFLVLLGFCVGVMVNYYGILFENIKLQVQVYGEENYKKIENETNGYAVPNIVHFIWFSNDGAMTLSFLNYISILSAHRIQKPEVIMLHCNMLPSGIWWDKLVAEVPIKIVHKELPTEIHGQKLMHVYHKGDVAKLEILLEYGGIYLDYDVIVLNSLDPVRKYEATLGKERPPKFIAGIIIARKGALFLRLLYESYRNNYRWLDWDYNCARVAYRIYEQRPDLLHVEPYKFTTPDWKDRHLLWNSIIDWKDLYLIHVMGHFLREEFTPESIKTINTTFGQIMRFIYYGSPGLILS